MGFVFCSFTILTFSSTSTKNTSVSFTMDLDEIDDDDAPPQLIDTNDVAAERGGVSTSLDDAIDDLSLVKVPITIVTGE